jgi:hypothetical protein
MLAEDLLRNGASRHDRPVVRAPIVTVPRILALLSLCLILACLPVLVTATPPMVDYLNHLGRAHILANWHHNELFQKVFVLDSLLLPNVLSDIVLAALSGWIGALAAGQVVLLLILILTVVGAFALNAAATKQLSTWPLLVALFLYNEFFFWGFLNYLLGIAILLWGCAAWLLLEPQSRRGQLAAMASFALLILFSHLVAFGLFAVAIAILEMEAAWHRRQEGTRKILVRMAGAAMAFAPALLLYLVTSPTRNLPLALQYDQHDLLFNKLSSFTRILSSGDTALDLVILGGAVLIVLVAFLRRSVSLEPGLAAVAAAFALLVLLMPHEAMGSFLLDKRIAVPSVILFLAALRPRNGHGHLGALGVAAVLILLALRSGGLMLDWQATGRDYAAIITGIRHLPEGGLVIPVSSWPAPDPPTWFRTTTRAPSKREHVAIYATILRGSVVPTIFARRGQNPIVLEPSSEALDAVGWGKMALGVEGDNALSNLLPKVAAQASAIRRTDPVFATRTIHLLLLSVTCDRWQATVPIAPSYCGDDFAIVEIK